jgi:DNA-binding XRE family transcriptional regulator
MNSQARQKFAQAVFDLRAGRDLRTFGKLVGVRHTTIIDWENCTVVPKMASIEKIAELRGETLQQFMDYLEGRQTLSLMDRAMSLVNGASKEQLAELLRAIAERLESI